MNDIVGIDLGTTNSLIGMMDAGFPVLIADANGERLTPSVVYISGDGEMLVGSAAARMRVLEPASTIYSVKRFIGLRGEDVVTKELDVSYKLVRRKGRALHIRIGNNQYAPEEISALVLRKLKADAEKALGRQVARAVITVPAYFNDAQRNATKRAGELAGFTVERIINEPTAAALAYGLDKLKSKSKIAVYDLGGGTFDMSILELNNGVFEVLATSGNTRLGGDDVDNAIISDRRFRISDWRPEQKARLREEIVRPIIERTRVHCLRALADAKFTLSDLDEVILVGGVTRMPLVRRFTAEIFGREPNVSQNPDEAVATGATIQAGILSGEVRDIVLLDVTPLSLGIETFGGLMNVIIPRNSTIPTKAGETFTTAVHNQHTMSIKVLQGEREMARDNWKLGEFEIEFAPAPKGVPRVGVQFEINENGILRVLARDIRTGREKIVEMKSAVDVSDEAVESMLAESLEHAFDDVSERIWTETKLKSEEMLTSVDSALQIVGDKIETSEKKRILRLGDEVRKAIEVHQVQKLKEANETLDAGTQHLAALVVEQAMATANPPG